MSAVATLTEEQHTARSKGVGASETAALLGLDPYRTQMDVWLSKTGRKPREEGTDHTRRGQYFERGIIQWHADKVGLRVMQRRTKTPPKGKCIVYGTTSQLAAHPLVLATPDFLILDEGLTIETGDVKSPSWRTAEEWHDGDAPDRYVVQVMQQMLVAGAPRGRLVAYVDEAPSPRFFERDEQLCGVIIETIERFWRDHVLTDRPPPPDGSEAYSGYIAQRFPTHSEEIRQATVKEQLLAAVLAAERRKLDAAETAIRATRQQLEELIGEAAGIQGEDFKITWKTKRGRTSLDTQSLIAELGASPELIEKHTKRGSSYREFRPSGPRFKGQE
jgi:putative phage-type endonuclease